MTSSVDRKKLFHERYAKVQKALRDKGLAGCLLTDPIQIRYATGTVMMPLWTAFNYCRYVLVLAEGEPVIWEYPEAQFVAREYWQDVRPCEYWQYRFSGSDAKAQATTWAKQIHEVLVEKKIANDLIGMDSLDFYGFKALEQLGIRLADADEVLQAARKIKLPAEIELIRESTRITERALKKFEDRIKPGVTENELLATFWEGILAEGGEWCYTRLIASGNRTNPWFQEASDKVVEKGELVGIDTDVIGLEGYAADFSRTFICDSKLTDEQLSLYNFTKDYLDAVREVMKPGLSHADMLAKLPKVPEKLLPQRYPIFAHGLGMDDEPPFYPFADQSTSAKSDEVLQPGMVMCIEFYAGEKGGAFGVKLEDQLLITESGHELMNSYPFLT